MNNMSSHKLFDVIQQEYMVCLLRAKIYPIAKHKRYWQNLAEKKKVKIEDLKNKYSLISIFDDKKVYDHYRQKIYKEYELPNFYYPSKELEKRQKYWDIKNYFAVGSKVIFIYDNLQKEGQIEAVNVDKKLVTIRRKNIIYELGFEKIKEVIHVINDKLLTTCS